MLHDGVHDGVHDGYSISGVLRETLRGPLLLRVLWRGDLFARARSKKKMSVNKRTSLK